MQEAKDKTQLKSKRSTRSTEPELQFFYPPLGLAGIASAFAFFLKTTETQSSKVEISSDDEIELKNIIVPSTKF